MKNKEYTTEATKEEVTAGNMQPATKGYFFYSQIIKNNGLSEFWNNEAHKMWNYKVLALFIPVLIVSDVEWSDGSGGDGLMVGFSRLNESDE